MIALIKHYYNKLTKKISEPARSDKWPTVRKHHLEQENFCRYCGGTKTLQVHHIEPFHIDPAKELDPNNLITLCEAVGKECHLNIGHLGDWKNFNVNVRTQANSTGVGIHA